MRLIGLKTRIAALGVASIAAVLMAFSLSGTASAHTTPDHAGDTPNLGVDQGTPAFDNYLGALSHSQAANSLLRNPTCGERDA